jgi:hypothetical protein
VRGPALRVCGTCVAAGCAVIWRISSFAAVRQALYGLVARLCVGLAGCGCGVF